MLSILANTTACRRIDIYAVTADSGTDEIKADNIPQAIEDLVRFPLGQQLYIRPTWREVQPRPGRLDMPDYLKLVFELAKKALLKLLSR